MSTSLFFMVQYNKRVYIFIYLERFLGDYMKKKLFKILFFLAITIAMILVLILNNDMDDIGKVLKSLKPIWLLIAILVLLLYLLINPLSLMVIIDDDRTIKKSDSFLIGSIEYFYNGITPSNTGAQPMQVLEYKRIGVSTSKSTGALLINSTVNQIAVVILCLFSMIYYKELAKNVVSIKILIAIGFSMNILVLLLYIAIGHSKLIKNWLISVVDWIVNRKVFKGKLVHISDRFRLFCEEAQQAFHNSLKNKWRFFLAIIFKLIALIIFYSLPFFILRALDIDLGPNFFGLVIGMTTFSIAMTCFIPTPGASGGIEFAFQSLFINLAGVTKTVAVSGMLLWRLLTYYLLMFISLLIYFYLEFVVIKKKKRKIEKTVEEDLDLLQSDDN